MSWGKLFISNQFSISEYSNVSKSQSKNKEHKEQNMEHISWINDKRVKLDELEADLEEISSVIPKEYLNPY
jgi:hypothetical protein